MKELSVTMLVSVFAFARGLSLAALCMFIAVGSAGADVTVEDGIVTLSDCASQTEHGQDFDFEFVDCPRSDGTDGTLTIHARGDYSIDRCFGWGPSDEYLAEYLVCGIDGITVADHSCPDWAEIIKEHSAHDVEWKESFTIPGDELINITSDSSVTIWVELSEYVHALWWIDPWVCVELTYSQDRCPVPLPPNCPGPPDGATNVPFNTCLSWNRCFRLLGGTGGDDPNPFSIVELQIDPVAEVLIGPDGLNFGLDFAPNGQLYGASGNLRLIDPADGSFTTIGPIGLLVDSITFHPNGTLYCAYNNDLYEVNLTTGNATKVVDITGGIVWGIEFAPDGTLYGAFSKLFIVDPTNGQATLIGDLLVGTSSVSVNDIDFAPDGYIYAADQSEKSVYKIDPSNAAIVWVGTYETNLWSVASQVPDAGSTTVMSQQTLNLVGSSAPVDTHIDQSVLIQEEQAKKTYLQRLRNTFLQQDEIQPGHTGVGVLGKTPDFSVDQGPFLASIDQSQCPTTWDVYLGTNPNALELIGRDLNETNLCPGGLKLSTRYYWQVVAKNRGGHRPGPIWSFMTGPAHQVPRIKDPSYESGTDWTEYGTSSCIITWRWDDWASHGTHSFEVWFSNLLCNQGIEVGDYGCFRQRVDFTGVDTLVFDYRTENAGEIKPRILIDNEEVWHAKPNDSTDNVHLNVPVDVSHITGVHTLELRAEVVSPGSIVFAEVQYDNLRTYGP